MAWLGRGKLKASATQPDRAPPPASRPSDVERRATEIGREILKSARDHRAGFFSTRFWSDQLMNWAMKDPAFKLQLFRFIDVFPMLRTPELVHDYLVDYLSQPGVTLPPGMALGLKAGGLAKGMMAKTIAGQITNMAHNFIASYSYEIPFERLVAGRVPRLSRGWVITGVTRFATGPIR